MKNIIKQILKEDRQEQFLNKIILLMKDEYPLIKNMDGYGFNLSEDELIYVLSGIFGKPVTVRDIATHTFIYNQNGNKIYSEHYGGYWQKSEYNGNGNIIYKEDSDGYWQKREYDENGNQIYYERSDGYREKFEYDENGNRIYEEDSNGYITDMR